MKRAMILGGGMVGSAIAMDLAKGGDLAVTVADSRDEVLDRIKSRCPIETVRADLGDAARVTRIVAGQDVVIGALPSVLGLQTLRAVIEAGRNYCDISFMPEDPKQLSALAVERGVTAVVDCGVAPGMSNMLSGWVSRELDVRERLTIYVGGLPVVRSWPFEYKAGFAPYDVIEEYTRPSRIVEHGRVVVKDALSETELLDFPGVGTLEAFNTDGLRTLIDTLDFPHMLEKTMRYPGHAHLMRILRETGFFGSEPIEVDGMKVQPRSVTAALMFPLWKFEPGEEDLVVLRVVAEGSKGGRPTRYRWDMIDRYDAATDTRAMSRTTGYPAAIMARLIADRRFDKPGVHPPEIPGREPGILDAVLAELEKRGIRFEARVEPIAR
jgi:saccharopine dehydrogenase-like NADP-dependent oxidoreductase